MPTVYHRFQINFVSYAIIILCFVIGLYSSAPYLNFIITYRFIEYNPTSLERNYKYEVLTEHDLGVTIDLINKDQYAPDFNQLLDPADEKLLEEDILTPQDSKRFVCAVKYYPVEVSIVLGLTMLFFVVFSTQHHYASILVLAYKPYIC